ncbi:MAG TPA: MASE1 domain-containing protein, partial [Burkholderiales bacterium]|nr:MASE1 domain-containing protein [Burkholderiales bacterium]
WLPSGIAVAAVVLWGPRCWPGLWLGAALANFSVNLSIPAAVGIATGNTLEALCAGLFVAPLFAGDAFRRPEQVFLFAMLAAVASAIAATVGTGALWLIGEIAPGSLVANWYTWWQGDATGILVLTPCVLAWAQPARLPARPMQRYEMWAFALLFAGVLAAIFARVPVDDAMRAIVFLAFPFLAWAACRFSEQAVTMSLLAATALAVWCTVNGRGPFAGASLNESLLTLQAFTSTAALIALALGAFTRERERTLRGLSASHDALDEAVRAQGFALGAREQELAQAQALAHVGLWSWDARSDRMEWSDELCRIHGVGPGAFAGSFADYLARVDARDRERMRTLLHGAMFESKDWEAIERIVRRDGTPRVLHSFCRVARRRHGAPARLHGFCVDITERVRLEQIQAVQHEIGLLLARAPSVEDAVHATLRIVCEKLEWRSARYWRVDAVAGDLRVAAVHANEGSQQPGAASALAERAWREQRALAGQDAAQRAAFAFPVTAAGEVLGVIDLDAGPRGEPDIELLEMASAVGALLGEFIMRSRTQQRVRESEERLRELARRLLDAHDAERRQVAAELRDAVARPLAAAHVDLGAARLEAPLAATRDLIAQLRPASLEDYGLLAALRAYALRFERRTGIRVAVIGAEDAAEIDARVETALFQIVRDALDNVARHARTQSAVIQLDVAVGTLALSIRDDGCGFGLQVARRPNAWGIVLMRERAAAIGARLRVASQPGRGTEVSIRVRA